MSEVARPRRRLAPGSVHLAAALLVLIVVVPLALNAAEPAPPAIAEFAPQLQQIKQPSSQQNGALGAGANAATPTPSPTPTPSAPGGAGSPTLPPKAIVHPCVGNPLRQTEDPQSPPCVPYWGGTDNGGSTSPGVTRTGVTIAVPEFAFGDPRAEADLFKFFNARYEFYGRTLIDSPFVPRGNLNAPPDPNTEDADAQQVKDQIGAFASTSTGFRQGAEFLYYDALARRGVISVTPGATSRQTDAHFRQFAPYEWGYQMPIDLALRNVGEFTCKVLVGKPPTYAGPAQQANVATRSFGELIERPADGSIPDDSPLLSALGNCGAGGVSQQRYEIDESGDVMTQARNAIIAMQKAGVTSVICTCFFSDLNGAFMQGATSQGYEPEWIVQSYSLNDTEDSAGSAPADQKLHEFGLSFNNKTQPQADAPWYWAVHEADPGYAVPQSDGGGYDGLYRMLLLLSSGIQAAGPNLTPQSFQEALQRLTFPNPGCGRAPYYQACAGFAGGSHNMLSDGTMIWHDPRQQGTVNSQSTQVCFVDHGARYQLGTWPEEAPRFQQGSCR